MAAESTGEEDGINDDEKNVKTSVNNDNSGRDQWVSFEEQCEVPLLPQPPSSGDNMNSEKYIDRLEQKLHRIKNPSNITSKNIVSALSEARESHMINMMNEETSENWTTTSHQTNDELNWDEEVAKPRCCCVIIYNQFINHLFPKQANTTQEVECLLDEDELAIVNSELDDTNLPNQQTIMT